MTTDALEKAVALEPSSPLAHFALGKAWHERGELSRAVSCYANAIALKPDFAAAHCNLGLAYFGLGRLQESVASCHRALEIEPASHVAHNSLGLALQRMGRIDEAVASYRRAIAELPDYAEAHSNLGVIAGDRSQYAEAAACFRKAVEAKPGSPEPHYNLGCALVGLDRLEEAMAELDAALKLKPDYWQACSMAGHVLQMRGQLAAALEFCTRAVRFAPDAAEARHRLGIVLRDIGRPQEAIAEFQRALALRPGFAEALTDQATACASLGDLEAAVVACRMAIDAKPDYPVAHCGLGIALAELGRIDEAIPAIRKAIELKPDYEAAHSAYLFHLNYSASHDPQAVFDAHKRWAQSHADGIARGVHRFENDRSAGRRLRIGYVSPDFRQHSVAFFLTPVLAHHDHGAFEVFCYSDVRRADAVTEQLRGYADCWRDVAGLSDEQVAAQVREDRIDILVDLAVHSGNNRLLVFARKPAPVQATWLGYASTTGLAAMDYKITDLHLDPPGMTEARHSEKLLRLPDCYFCYTPPPGYPAVTDLPAAARGSVIFCAFQNLAKVSPKAIGLWSQAMLAVPDSRLVLKARGLSSEATRQRLREAFGACGIGATRLQFEDWGDMTQYLTRLGEVDIALDTVPFNGGTTTFHALWMGVPTVTLMGQSALGRMGMSILYNLGLPELVAQTPNAYADIARCLASDPKRLSELRSGLRERMTRSPLMDAPRFTLNLESLYRRMWYRWCRQRA